MYTIIEDCSPYYIRYTHPSMMSVINRCQDLISATTFPSPFIHYKFDRKAGQEILDQTPLTTQFDLNSDGGVALLATHPGHCCRIHKDGVATHVSFNYTIKILDDKCSTSWFSDEDMKIYEVDNHHYLEDSPPKPTGRRLNGCDKSKHIPLKTMNAKPNEAILFNTEIWHDFDNRQSQNERIVLTLRLRRPDELYFEDARKIMFGF